VTEEVLIEEQKDVFHYKRDGGNCFYYTDCLSKLHEDFSRKQIDLGDLLKSLHRTAENINKLLSGNIEV
jgi:hypothetical protein